MPQIQLPLFPEGSTAITPHLGVLVEGEDVVYLNGHLPVFTHQKNDLRSFRFFTSKMVIAGAVTQSQIAKAFGISVVTVKRYVKRVRQEGINTFVATPRRRAAPVLTGEVLQRAEDLLAQGWSVPQVGRELKIRPNTLHKAIRAGRLGESVKKKVKGFRS